MDYRHYLVTRFNVLFRRTEQKDWAEHVEHKSFRVRNNDMWLEKRLELFELYCLPSVRGQTNKNFQWVILMSEDTPPRFVNHISARLPDDSYIVSGSGEMLDYTIAKKAMELLTPESTEWVASTSLDSDDALSKDFIATVQKHIRPEKMYINLLRGVTAAHHKGFQYIGEREGRGVNHFRTLVEPRARINSVYMVSHGESHLDAPVENVTSEARWLEVIHGDNCSNRFKKKRHDKTRPLEELAGMFSLDKTKVKNEFDLDHGGYVIDETWGRPL